MRGPARRRGGARLRLPRGPAGGCAASSASSDPVLIGVDAGADALLDAGHRPDVVVVGEHGLGQGGASGERSQHRSRQGAARRPGGGRARRPVRPRVSGTDRLDRLGRAPPDAGRLRHHRGRRAARSPTSGGASLIVAVGTPRHARRVPRPAAGRAGQHVPDPAAGRAQAGRRQGRAGSCTPAGSALWHLALVLLAGLLAARRGGRGDPGRRRLVAVARAAAPSDVLDLDPRTAPVISFRYHIVSIVSVFLALAVGVALGGGPLKGEVDNTAGRPGQGRPARRRPSCRPQVAGAGSTQRRSPTTSPTPSHPGSIGQTLSGRVVTSWRAARPRRGPR